MRLLWRKRIATRWSRFVDNPVKFSLLEVFFKRFFQNQVKSLQIVKEEIPLLSRICSGQLTDTIVKIQQLVLNKSQLDSRNGPLDTLETVAVNETIIIKCREWNDGTKNSKLILQPTTRTKTWTSCKIRNDISVTSQRCHAETYEGLGQKMPNLLFVYTLMPNHMPKNCMIFIIKLKSKQFIISTRWSQKLTFDFDDDSCCRLSRTVRIELRGLGPSQGGLVMMLFKMREYQIKSHLFIWKKDWTLKQKRKLFAVVWAPEVFARTSCSPYIILANIWQGWSTTWWTFKERGFCIIPFLVYSVQLKIDWLWVMIWRIFSPNGSVSFPCPVFKNSLWKHPKPNFFYLQHRIAKDWLLQQKIRSQIEEPSFWDNV